MKRKAGGYKIVLTADRTLMSEYSGGIFLGFSACIPRGLIPDRFYFSMFCPSVPVNADGSVKYAPCGLRKTEAQLLSNFSREDIIVAHPDHLHKVVGTNTKVLGIAETDPLGMGPATTTFTQVLGGEAYMAMKFQDILNHPAVQRYTPKIIVGGPGAWQLEDPEPRKRLGVDCVVVGEGEKVVNLLFEKAVMGYTLPEVVQGPMAEEQDIPLIQGGTIDGIVEIARGCGRGCAFCVPTLQRYRCMSIEHILKEVEVNLKAERRPLLHAEDVLRYKAKGLEVNAPAVAELFSAVYNHPGVKSLGKSLAISHFALSSVASAPDLIEDLSSILEVKQGAEWMGGQTGLETGSPRLIKELMAGKAKPFEPEQWPQVVVDAFQILSNHNWVPLATLIIGLPTETEADVQMTIELVSRLRKNKSLLVPLFMVSEGGLRSKVSSFRVEDITRKQSELFVLCWEHNLTWASTFMDEYFLLKSGLSGRFLKLVFSYGLKEAWKLLKAAKKEYDYDISAMIKDAYEGKFPLPLPLRIATKLMGTESLKRKKK